MTFDTERYSFDETQGVTDADVIATITDVEADYGKSISPFLMEQYVNNRIYNKTLKSIGFKLKMRPVTRPHQSSRQEESEDDEEDGDEENEDENEEDIDDDDLTESGAGKRAYSRSEENETFKNELDRAVINNVLERINAIPRMGQSTYYAHIEGSGEGCDYTIRCNFDAKDLGSDPADMIDIVMQYLDDDRVDDVEVIEVVRVMPVLGMIKDAIKSERSRVLKDREETEKRRKEAEKLERQRVVAEEQANREQMEREMYEQLKAKFEHAQGS